MDILREQNEYAKEYLSWYRIRGLENTLIPTTGLGIGGKNFSWTAALVIDMIKMKNLPFGL